MAVGGVTECHRSALIEQMREIHSSVESIESFIAGRRARRRLASRQGAAAAAASQQATCKKAGGGAASFLPAGLGKDLHQKL
jgi:predicted kinase